jgi:hypothetical protein
MSEFTSSDPAEIMAGTPKYPSREDTLKTVQDKFPGHIAWASDRGSFSGNRVITFVEGGAQGLEPTDEGVLIEQMKLKGMFEEGADAAPEAIMNLYFSTRSNLLVVDMAVSETTITILVTTQLDGDDLEEFQEVNRRIQIEMRPWREERAAAKQKAADEVRENQRLIEVGRKAETYNLNGKYDKVLEENKALKAKLAYFEKDGE